MPDKFDVLVEEVAAIRGVNASVIKLLERLDERLADAADDPAQIAAIRDELTAERQRLADAVAARSESTESVAAVPSKASKG